jgi:hypothetical protein
VLEPDRRTATRRVSPLPIWFSLIIAAAFVAISWGRLGVRERFDLARLDFAGDHMDMKVRPEAEAAASPSRLTREFLRSRSLHWFDHVPIGGYPYPPASDLARPRAEVVEGNARVVSLEEAPAVHRVRVDAAGPALLRLNLHRFPGWTLLLDGREIEPAPAPGRRPILMARVPAGEHLVEARFLRTPPRRWGDGISAAAALITLGLAFSGLRKRGPSATDGSSGK